MDGKELALLTKCFTITVRPGDVLAIRFKARKNFVSLLDVGQILGNVITSAEKTELAEIGHTIPSFVKWLEQNGAKKQYVYPKLKRTYYPLYD